MFGKEPDISINPDEAVSLGAAILAAQEVAKIQVEIVPEKILEKVGGIQITDVVNHSIGIEVTAPGSQQKINSVLIKKNSPIPCEVSREFVTSIPGQTAIKLTVYQGEFQNPALCNPIGEFSMTGLPPNRPSGKKVRVTLICTANGMVEISAKDIESGVETSTEVIYAFADSGNEVNVKKLWLEAVTVE